MPLLPSPPLLSLLTDTDTPDIGYHAAHLLHTAPAPLRTLRLLAQDFPKYAVPLARRALAASGHEGGAGDGAPGVFDAVFDEVQANHFKAAPGVNMVWLNGAVVADGDANPFACVPSFPRLPSNLYVLLLP